MNEHNNDREAYARKVVGDFASEFWRDRAWQISQMLPFADMTSLLLQANVRIPHGEDWLMRGMEPQEWLLMARAGLGLVEADNDTKGEVYEVCQGLAEWLFHTPGGSGVYTIPDTWADHPLGQLWHLAMIWLAGDELITISEAAKLAGVTTQAIHGRIARGRLHVYIDPNAPAHQGRRLVRRSAVQEEAPSEADLPD